MGERIGSHRIRFGKETGLFELVHPGLPGWGYGAGWGRLGKVTRPHLQSAKAAAAVCQSPGTTWPVPYPWIPVAIQLHPRPAEKPQHKPRTAKGSSQHMSVGRQGNIAPRMEWTSELVREADWRQRSR
jgi:hypothetical protein